MLVEMTGMHGDYQYGQVLDLSKGEADELIRACLAKPYKKDNIETAARAPGEKAARTGRVAGKKKTAGRTKKASKK